MKRIYLALTAAAVILALAVIFTTHDANAQGNQPTPSIVHGIPPLGGAPAPSDVEDHRTYAQTISNTVTNGAVNAGNVGLGADPCDPCATAGPNAAQINAARATLAAANANQVNVRSSSVTTCRPPLGARLANANANRQVRRANLANSRAARVSSRASTVTSQTTTTNTQRTNSAARAVNPCDPCL